MARGSAIPPPRPATADPAADLSQTNIMELIERIAMILRIGSRTVGEYYAELVPRYGGLGAAVAIRSLPDLFIDMQVHTKLDLVDAIILGMGLDRFGAGLGHDLREIFVKVNLLKGWGVDDPVHGPANRHVDVMFAEIMGREGDRGLSLCRREIARAFLNVQEARVYMYHEITGKGYAIPPEVAEWVATRPSMDDIRLALEGLETEGIKTLPLIMTVLRRLEAIGVEGLVLMASAERGERVRNWIEGLARDSGGLRTFIYDPRLQWRQEPLPEQGHLAWKNEIVIHSRLYLRGIESRTLRQARFYPEEGETPDGSS